MITEATRTAPRSRPAHLMTRIAGWKHRGEAVARLLPEIRLGHRLDLVKDPNNSYDPNAVQVWHGSIMLGFIPREHSMNIRRLLEAQRVFCWKASGFNGIMLTWITKR